MEKFDAERMEKKYRKLLDEKCMKDLAAFRLDTPVERVAANGLGHAVISAFVRRLRVKEEV